MGSLKTILILAVIGFVVYVGWLLIPPYFANYQFEDVVKTEALNATYTTRTEDEIRDSVFKKARDLDIAITKDQIKVHRVGGQGTGSIAINVDYTVHVDIPGYPLDLQFHCASANKGLY